MANALTIAKNVPNGSLYIVGIGDLRVMITHEGSEDWLAQGLEVDYFATGRDLENVKKAFEIGLRRTISEHLKRFRHIKHLLHPAPEHVWADFSERALSGNLYSHSQISFHALDVESSDTTIIATTEAEVGSTTAAVKKRRSPRTPAPRQQILFPYDGIRYLASQAAA